MSSWPAIVTVLVVHLTRRTDYGLRLLMLLAVDDEAPVGLNDAATRLEVSANHLAKVAQALVHADLIRSIRGRAGGFMLLPKTRETTVADIVEALEPMALVECFDDAAACTLSPACRLHGILGEASQAFLDTLRRHTLGELVARRRAPLLRLTRKQA